MGTRSREKWKVALLYFFAWELLANHDARAQDFQVYQKDIATDDQLTELELGNPAGRVRVARSTRHKRQASTVSQQYVDAHNDARAIVSPTATNMLKMKWSSELATVAENYAKRCIWGHNAGRTSDTQALTSQFSYVGENLYVTSRSSADPSAAVKAWDDEKSDYTYSTKACSAVCGHYTQVVWSNSEYVGCASHTCSSFTGLSSAFNGGTIVVCNYGPGGNFNGRHPYATGTSCSACPSGYTCSNNLCDDGSGNTNVVEPVVDSVSPNEGSLCGETRLLISGRGFSQDNINEGNQVQLVSGTTSYDCPVSKDGTTELKVMCYTPPGMKDDTYYVRLTVDGKKVPENKHCGGATSSKCRFRPHSGRTPKITSLDNEAVAPGSIITIRGKMFTDRFDTNVEESSNGRTEKILRVYGGPMLCALKKENENDVFYGMALDNGGTSDNGYMKCKLGGTFVGNNNASFIISDGFGRSCRSGGSLYLSRNGQIYQYQTYAEITSVTPNTGSIGGCTTLTITGRNFDDKESRSKTQVFVGETKCEVQSLTTTEIVCKTATQPSPVPTSYPGNRGLTLEIWNNTVKSHSNLDDVLLLNDSAADYVLSHTDKTYFSENLDNYVSRARGYFIPPYTGVYAFMIMADDGGSLYFSNSDNPADKTKIAFSKSYTNKYTKFPDQMSQRVNLTANKKYYMEILHRENSVAAYAKVAAHLYDTKLTNESMPAAKQENQLISVRSSIVREKQTVTLSGFSTKSSVNEVQEVDVTENSGSFSDATFRLGLDGVYTTLLTTATPEANIGSALLQLPVFHPSESVTVTAAPKANGAGIVLTVTFSSKRGNINELQYKTYRGSNGETLGITVTEKKTGVPSGEYFTLSMAGVTSPLLAYDLSANDMKDGLNQLFGVRCPKAIASPAATKVHHTFEESIPGGLGGSRVGDEEAFCGKYSVKNPWYLYRDDTTGLRLGQSVRMLCFAYKGVIRDLVRLYYSYTDAQNVKQTGKATTFSHTMDQTADIWKYACFDMYTSLTGKVPTGTSFILTRVQVYRESTEVLFDEVIIGRERPLASDADISTVNLLRMKASTPNNYRMDEVKINKTTVNNNPTYEITLIPFNCGYNFRKFQSASGQVVSGGSVSVVRTQTASPPVQGSFTVTFAGKSKSGIPYDVTGESLIEMLESGIPEMGKVYAYRHGDCASFDLSVAFLTNAGDQEEMQLTSQLSGVDVTLSISTVVNGGITFDPIQGDMLMTYHDKPQVMAYINDIPTKCSGDCTFEWTMASTMTVTSVNPTTATTGNDITIVGTNFDSVPSNHNITIGGEACTPKSSTATQIICTVGSGPAGSYPIEIVRASKGCTHNANGNVTFTYPFQLTSVSPLTSNLGGGIDITLTGYGFSKDDNDTIADIIQLLNSDEVDILIYQPGECDIHRGHGRGGIDITLTGYGFSKDDNVTIAGSPCSKKSTTSTQIVCTAPNSKSAGAGDVVVHQTGGSTVTFGSQYTYINTGMTVISSISPSTISVGGGDTLTISGSNFDPSSTLTIGDTVVPISSITTTSVTAVLPAMQPGNYPIKLSGSSGYAVDGSNNIPSLSIKFRITNVYPLQGSLMGGTRVTLTGEGFSTNTTGTAVRVGQNDCIIESATSTQIICLIQDTATVHKVDNQGIHPQFKLSGYAWNPKNLEIKTGDIVEWRWFFASYITGFTPRVVQVKDEVSTEEFPGGFNSGAPAASGMFRHRFTVAGKYCYWSDYCDIYKTTFFRGCVNVVDRPPTSTGEVSVTIGQIAAQHIVNSGVSNPVDTSACKGSSGLLPSCSVPPASPTGSTKFQFTFSHCSTPVITSISRQSGSSQDVIDIQGEGFSSTECQNEVYFGNNLCSVTAATSTKISCNIDPSSSPQTGIMEEIRMRHNNMGNALIRISGQTARTFALVPEVTDIVPPLGSVMGGNEIEIMGTGFDDDIWVTVTIGGYPCPVSEATYTSIKCTARNLNSAGPKTLEVSVTSPTGSSITAKCGVVCQYVYDPNVTPKLTGVTPGNVAGGSPTSLRITGSKFGTVPTAVSVTVGDEICTVSSVTDSSIVCVISYLPAGSNAVKVLINDVGLAQGSLTVTGDTTITSLSSTDGSTNGGSQLTIDGNGFVSGTTVTMDGSACVVTEVHLNNVTCTTPAHTAGAVVVAVTSNGQTYPQQSYTYATASTPAITAVSPAQGSAGTTLVLTGQNFGATNAENAVSVGGAACVVTSSSATEVRCTAGVQNVGSFAAVLTVTNKGKSNNDQMFEYQLLLSSITPTSGSSAGGQTVTLSGSGFDAGTTATVCGQPCVKVVNATQTAGSFVCKTPAATAPVVGTQACDVNVTENGVSRILAGGYTYDASKTAEITGISPVRGGTGGGTSLTITGTGFGSVKSDVTVTIAGTPCDVTTVTNTQVVCTTNQHSKSEKVNIEVEVAGNGIATQTSAEYFYVDVWSSPFTWGGGPLPKDGDFVVVSKGQNILLDVDTPKLKIILIRGGGLIFDEKNLHLQAENILITDHGVLQIGTETAPFQQQATITLHGHHRSKEFPIYGVKSIAVRTGKLELHGKPVATTWTTLASTAAASSSTIVLKDAVTWKAGDQIVIATTSHRHSQRENEFRTIQSISGDQKTVTLTAPLTYEHLGVSETFDGTQVEFRAEVGMVTRNIKIQGASDSQWVEKIEACPNGFDTGEFATQTCFQGRFGEEMGSDQFGAQIMIHSPVANQLTSHAHIEYVELFHVGQAFRLGRYPIHFHLNGDNTGSYVRGCGIHETFNRAVNIHGSHNILVEKNVVYNVMGGAMFFEDGIETGNTLQNNLLVFVRESTSLQNDDVTPAAFWSTNPNNTVQFNHAAGGSHFGFWFRMHGHPDGPSFDPNICPTHVPVGVFKGNVAHSNGWFGLWIFPTMISRTGGGCGSKTPYQSVFESLTAWNNEKGAEVVNGGAYIMKDFVLVNNKLAGFEGKKILEGEQVIQNSLIVGHASSLTKVEQGCTRGGVVLPYGYGFKLDGIRFVNFDESGCATIATARITGTCSFLCGGFLYHTQALKFVNAPNKGRFEWLWESVLKDLDGTLIGETGDAASIAANVGKTAISTSDTLPPTCVSFPKFSTGVAASACDPNVKFHRFAFNEISPSSILYKDAIFINRFGNVTNPYRKKAITHPKGWNLNLVDGEEYEIVFENAEHLSNISYNGRFDLFTESGGTADYVIIKQKLANAPDRFMMDGRTHKNGTQAPLDPNTDIHGAWEYVSADKQIKYLISARTTAPNVTAPAGRKKRASPSAAARADNLQVNFKSYKCFFTDCIPPPDPNTIPPVDKRPSDPQLWSDKGTWNGTEPGWGGYNNGSYDLPVDGDDVKIPEGKWVIADTVLPRMGKLVLYGVLELDHNSGTRDFVLNCTYLVILGGRLIAGFPNEPFLSNLLISLQGDHGTNEYKGVSGPPIGSKVIASFGGLDLHGIDKGDSWTQLVQTVNAGDTQLRLQAAVNWTSGDKIIVAPTGYDTWQAETVTITAVSADKTTVTVTPALQYRHIAHTETANGMSIKMAAEVGLLSRNVKIEGGAYLKQEGQSFGARIVVGQAVEGPNAYIGYARISNVEFVRSGQEGYIDPWDSRSAVAFIDAGTVTAIKPSYVRSCSFYHSYAPAVTVYGTNNLPIEWNVMADNVWFAIESQSDNTQIRNNFITKTQWEGAYQDRLETFNVRYNGAINLDMATNPVLEYNHVGGCERVGFVILGEQCSAPGKFVGNVAHSCLLGVANIMKTLTPDLSPCVKIANFTVWKNLDYGIYYQNSAPNEMSDILAADNGVSIFQFIAGPSATGHAYADRYVTLKNSLVVGTSGAFDCATDKVPNDDNIQLSGNSRRHPGSNMRVGVTMPTFSSGPNSAPGKPFAGVKKYQAIMGRFSMQDVTLAKFSDVCGNGGDFAVTPNAANDDGNHPMYTKRVTFIDVTTDYRIKYWRSSIGKINSADCVDMACDAKVKSLMVDEDGSFLGSPGAVIPQSEHEWNGDPRMGLGDYRIPKEMQTRLDGTRIPVSQLAPNKGIIRTNNCVYRSKWQAYECHDYDYFTLTIESMDSDTETRRLSPVAILGDGYLDLINGPQDHGWCSGYTCRKRLSTFQALVASGKDYLLHYTSTSPQNSRFFLLNAKDTDCIVLSIWYSQPWRLDVYHDSVYVKPENVRFVNPGNRYIIDPPPVGQPNFFKPNVTGCQDTAGASYFDRDSGILTINIRGSKPIDVKTVDVIIVSFQFPAMKESDFFGENIVMNIAAFCDIDASRVRITNIVRETPSVGRRRKRSAGDVTGFSVEIGNPPTTDLNSTAGAGDLTSSQLETAGSKIVNEIQLGNFSQIINVSQDTTYSIAEAPPTPGSPEWGEISTDDSPYTPLYIVDAMKFNPALVPQHEGVPFATQPKVQIVDKNGNVIKKLGTSSHPWRVTASIRVGTGNPSTVLEGNTTANVVDGWANFTNLLITHFGQNYVLDFNISYPDEGENVSLSSDPFTISGRPIKGSLVSRSTTVVEKALLSVVLELKDEVTLETISNITWRGHTWTVRAELGMPDLYNGSLVGTTTTTFDTNTAQASFYSLNLTSVGVYVVKFTIVSSPADYNFTYEELISVKAQSHINLVVEDTQEVVVKFNEDYDTIVGTTNNKYFAAMMGYTLANTYPEIILSTISVMKGSIIVTFQISGSNSSVNSTVFAVCSSIQSGQTYSFNGQALSLTGYLTVGGTTYYGVTCGDMTPAPTSSDSLNIALIVAVVLAVVVVLLVAGGFLLWKCKVVPRTKTHDYYNTKYLGNTKDIDEILFREQSFMSISAPMATNIHYDKKQPL